MRELGGNHPAADDHQEAGRLFNRMMSSEVCSRSSTRGSSIALERRQPRTKPAAEHEPVGGHRLVADQQLLGSR